ncbi:oligosaccharide flippase family protein, partial [Photobacterium sanctipauli]
MSFFSRILKSSFWITLSKLLNRGLAFFCTLILARILTPDDFGIIALATIVTAFFETLGQLGTKEYLLQEEAPSKEDIDTSWTLQLITKIIISIIIFSSSGILADFFNTQDLENLIK